MCFVSFGFRSDEERRNVLDERLSNCKNDIISQYCRPSGWSNHIQLLVSYIIYEYFSVSLIIISLVMVSYNAWFKLLFRNKGNPLAVLPPYLEFVHEKEMSHVRPHINNKKNSTQFIFILYSN